MQHAGDDPLVPIVGFHFSGYGPYLRVAKGPAIARRVPLVVSAVRVDGNDHFTSGHG